ncbi:hypothetical protein MMC07_004244 [Pseudocyphellaria aurata]|nr:hypothetical protein [Pseudocyphellaria aurata]
MKRRRNATATEKGISAVDPTSDGVSDQTRSGTSMANFLGVLVPGRPEGVTERVIKAASVEDAERAKQGMRSEDSQADMSSNLEIDASPENEVHTVKVPKAIHKRFGSEETELQPPQLGPKSALEVEENISPQSDEASDDEAPETVTAEAGFKRARAAAANAAKTIQRGEAISKQKRKERDARFNLQARSSRKRDIIESNRPRSSPPESKIDLTEKNDEADPQSPLSFHEPLPTFLPESILLAEPPNLFPDPSSALSISKKPSKKKTPATKRKLLDLTTKHPIKDVKHGSGTIRVLAMEGSMLPPRASQGSKALREGWLTGSRGGERGSVPRRSVQGGFVRK